VTPGSYFDQRGGDPWPSLSIKLGPSLIIDLVDVGNNVFNYTG